MNDHAFIKSQPILNEKENLLIDFSIQIDLHDFFITPVESQVMNTDRGPVIRDLVIGAINDPFDFVHRDEFKVLLVREILTCAAISSVMKRPSTTLIDPYMTKGSKGGRIIIACLCRSRNISISI